MAQARGERGILIVIAMVCAMLSMPLTTRAAQLLLSPASGSVGVGAELTVRVQVDPGGEGVNAADGEIKFDPALLSVSGISKDGSSFSLWTAEPSFSNSAGTISFSGGTPSAFSNPGTVITIRFAGKAEGTAAVSFTKGSILAADGKGTDVYDGGNEGSYTVTKAAAPPPPPPPAQTQSVPNIDDLPPGPTPLAPVISSPTHQKDDGWYSTTTVMFTWRPPPDVLGVRVKLSDKAEDDPDEELKDNPTTDTRIAPGDGTWYYHIQYKNDSGWGEKTTRALLIDTVPPEEFEVALAEAESASPKFTFTAQDALSGVDRYEIALNGTIVGTVKADDLVDGSYLVPPQEGGPTKVSIKAFDKAGNSTETVKEFTLPAVKKMVAGQAEETVQPRFFTPERILLILFAFIIGILTTMVVYARKGAQETKLHILASVMALREKNDRVFGAMREEFEQMISDFDARPQLTPEERNFLENTKEVLDISEELIDISIEELKKTIRGQQ